MERLMNDGWQFQKLPKGSTLEEALSGSWQPVAIPHDWLIAQANDLYQTSDGWYLRSLYFSEEEAQKCCIVRFDGVYMDCDVLLDGEVILTHPYGYTAFDADLTGRIHAGENRLMVHIRHESPNSRWYSGAGIYRDVTLSLLEECHIVPDGVYVVTRQKGDGWQVDIRTEVSGPCDGVLLSHRITDAEGRTVAEGECTATDGIARCSLTIDSPQLWSHKTPYCYRLHSTLGSQTLQQNIGLRTIETHPDKGLLVNGEVVKLNGVCLHHDLGALGSAFHEKAARRQLRIMQEMGVNALRTSHNPPARQVMELCDEMGIYVVDEAFDMWEMPKTTYDYGRFFPEYAKKDVAAWVRRDRNHPSLLMWSIGNEIPDTNNTTRGPELTRLLSGYVRRHDPEKNGLITIGSNYMPWEGAQLCAEHLEAVGYNYAEKYYPVHHEKYPHWVIYGSETASILSSRGIYHFPLESALLSDDDLQCSSLGNSCTSWGARSFGECIVIDQNLPYSMGQFIWSGIDYIGEPTPYHTRNCYFGQTDTACFPKDSYYMFQALWAGKPMVHIGIYWNWNKGQLIDVPVSACGDSVELFLNGKSLGRQQLDRRDPVRCRGLWKVPFEPGELLALCYDARGEVIARDVQRSFGDSAKLRLVAEDAFLLADNKDMTFLTVSAVDKDGNPVMNAADRVHITIDGPGFLMGMDNGDSTDTDPYQTRSRRLFSGKLLAILGAGDIAGEIRIRAEAEGLEAAELVIPVREAAVEEGRCRLPLVSPSEAPKEAAGPAHVRQIRLTSLGSTSLSPENPSVSFRAECLPACASDEIRYKILTPSGVESFCAKVLPTEDGCTVTGLGDGKVYLRAFVNNGFAHARVLSHMEIELSGFGQTSLDPYRFISGGLCDLTHGEITPGNDHGVAFARDGRSIAGFTNVDFGPVGSDEITLPVFALTGEHYDIGLWLGDPENGGEHLCTLPYEKPSIWNVYQPETYRLPRRITGLQTLCFVMEKKIHLKGFSFTKQSRAWLPQTASDADSVYGDSFTREGSSILGIGNNVSLVYENMDFEDCRKVTLTLEGATELDIQPVNLRITDGEGVQHTSQLLFTGGAGHSQAFTVDVPAGMCSLTFVFLPGSRFDFHRFCLTKFSE